MTEYDPERPLPPDQWLALDEQERVHLITAFHKKFNGAHPRVPNREGHALFHSVIETQVALGEQAVVRAIERLRSEGLTRHEALHAVGSVLSSHIYQLLAGQRDQRKTQASYSHDLESLTASSWRQTFSNG